MIVRAAVPEDVARVVPMMRPQDVHEFEVLGLGSPASLLRSMLDASPYGVAFEDGDVLAVAGVHTPSVLTPGVGHPWMFRAVASERVPLAFGRETRRWMRAWSEHYDMLVCYAAVEDRATRRWLEWIGFEVDRVEAYGMRGEPFHRLEMRRV